MGAVKGQSKLRFINTYMWDQPWFVELDYKQKLAYFFVHSKCSDIGVYLHSEKAMLNHLGYAYSIDEIVDWMNTRRDIVIKIDGDTLLLQWNLKELSKRGTKIKPISNPDLGKVREAIESKTLDHLIENGSFHVECKLFEFGISESIIENTSYSAKVKKGREQSDYEEMINKVRLNIDKKEGLKKAFLNLIEGLSKPLQSVLIQKSNNSKPTNNSQSYSHDNDSGYNEIAKGLEFNCVDFLIEDEVRKKVEELDGFVPKPIDTILYFKKEFQNEFGLKREWEDFLKYLDKELKEAYQRQ